MSWRSEGSTAQQTERGVLSNGLLSFGWRGAADATGHPLDDGNGEVDRGYYVGEGQPENPWRRLQELNAELSAEWGGGCSWDDAESDAFTQWRGRRAAARRWRRDR